MVQSSLTGLREVVEYVALLLAQRVAHGEHALDEAAARRTVGAEAALAPQHPVAACDGSVSLHCACMVSPGANGGKFSLGRGGLPIFVIAPACDRSVSLHSAVMVCRLLLLICQQRRLSAGACETPSNDRA